MTDDLVERLLDWPYQGETMAHEAADRIEALTADRENRLADLRIIKAERDRLRQLLSEIDKCIVWEALGFGNDFADQVQAALKGETP